MTGVTRFGEISPHWQNFEPTLTIFDAIWLILFVKKAKY